MTNNIFEKANYDIDKFLRKHPESRNLTKDEIKSIKVLCDTAIKFNFGNDVFLGPGRCSTKNCIFKTADSLWIVWEAGEWNKFIEPKSFDNSLDACIAIIKKHSEKTNAELNFLNHFFNHAILNNSLNEFAKKTNYTYTNSKIRIRKI